MKESHPAPAAARAAAAQRGRAAGGRWAADLVRVRTGGQELANDPVVALLRRHEERRDAIDVRLPGGPRRVSTASAGAAAPAPGQTRARGAVGGWVAPPCR